jgi:hypothetical protein
VYHRQGYALSSRRYILVRVSHILEKQRHASAIAGALNVAVAAHCAVRAAKEDSHPGEPRWEY